MCVTCVSISENTNFTDIDAISELDRKLFTGLVLTIIIFLSEFSQQFLQTGYDDNNSQNAFTFSIIYRVSVNFIHVEKRRYDESDSDIQQQDLPRILILKSDSDKSGDRLGLRGVRVFPAENWDFDKVSHLIFFTKFLMRF